MVTGMVSSTGFERGRTGRLEAEAPGRGRPSRIFTLADLGFRADAYVGWAAWSPLRTGRDVALVRRAERQSGLRILRSAAGACADQRASCRSMLRRGSRTICRRTCG